MAEKEFKFTMPDMADVKVIIEAKDIKNVQVKMKHPYEDDDDSNYIDALSMDE